MIFSNYYKNYRQIVYTKEHEYMQSCVANISNAQIFSEYVKLCEEKVKRLLDEIWRMFSFFRLLL